MTKTFTVSEMLDAIEKDGLEQITDNLFLFDDKTAGDRSLVGPKVIGACALGMACINLGIKDTDDWDGQNVNEDEGSWVHSIFEWVSSMNDNERLTFEEIAHTFRKRYPEYLNFTIKAGEFEYSI